MDQFQLCDFCLIFETTDGILNAVEFYIDNCDLPVRTIIEAVNEQLKTYGT